MSLEQLTLAQRFALTGSIVMVLAGALIGWWVAKRIEMNVISSTASQTALYIDSFIEPLTQELDKSDELSVESADAIEKLLTSGSLARRVVLINIWKPDGIVAYSDDPTIIGRTFPVSDNLTRALQGQVVTNFEEAEVNGEPAAGGGPIPLLKIYSPIRKSFAGEVIGVVEFYENGTRLQQVLSKNRWQAVVVVSMITLTLGLILFAIVQRGSHLIERQRRELQARLGQIEAISAQNRDLLHRVEAASSEVSELNEAMLRRISAELHDGPKQLIGYATMRFDSLARGADSQRADEFSTVLQALKDAQREISNLCSDLALPEIEGQPVDEMLRGVAAAHTMRTGSAVDLKLDVDPRAPLQQSARLCAYRFAQETLNNSWRHAGGGQQTLRARQSGPELYISVTNGPGSPPPDVEPGRVGGLGLAGLRKRVESLGGTFAFRRLADGGALAEMRISTNMNGRNHG